MVKNYDILKIISQFIKFGIVGGINTVVSLAIYYLMVYFGVDYIIATVTGYIGSSVIGYMLNRIWVFKAQNTKVMNSALKYFIVYGTSLLINMGCMYLWIDVLHLSQYIAPILTLCITVPFNYVFSKLWAFKENHLIG